MPRNHSKNAPSGRTSRRQFVAALAGAAAASHLTQASAIKPSESKTSEEASGIAVCIFSKHLQWLDYGQTASTAAEVGFDGLDLTVRPRGHVLPERVETDLPKAVEAAKAAGIKVPMMTTAITDPNDPRTEAVLKTASEHGIRYYRLGYYRYEDSKGIANTLEEVKRQLRGIAKLNERYGICGDYQNHAGGTHFGAPLWDIWETTRDLDPRWIGCQFDPRHAAVEGANSWPVEFRLLASRIHTLAMKDFQWEKTDEGWSAANCPLGQGAVDFEKFFDLLTKARFAGPISLHFEYPLGGANRGARTLTIEKGRVLSAMRRDLKLLTGWLKEAGL